MKYEITPEDRKIMENDLRTDRTLKHLQNLSFYKFSVGDVLIREEKYYKYNGSGISDYEWKTKIADCNLPYKYVYVFENDLGVGYIRRLSVNGRKFVERATCVTEFDPDQTRFALDPEYADHMLLSSEEEEFDAKSRYDQLKKKREQVHRKNKKIAISLADEAAAIAWMNTLKIGDKFWYGHSIGNIYKEPYFVTEINLQAPPPQTTSSTYTYYTQLFSPHIRMSMQPPSTTSSNQYQNTLYAHNASRYYIFTERPTFVDEIIN